MNSQPDERGTPIGGKLAVFLSRPCPGALAPFPLPRQSEGLLPRPAVAGPGGCPAPGFRSWNPAEFTCRAGNLRYAWELIPHSRGGIAIAKYSIDFAYTAQITVDTFFHYLYHPSQPEEFDFAGTDQRTRFRKGKGSSFRGFGQEGSQKPFAKWTRGKNAAKEGGYFVHLNQIEN
jgi:hypothetical protein